MINLQDSSGLPLLFNTQENLLSPMGDICVDCTDTIRLDAIRPILLNKTLRYPSIVYTEYCDICLPKHEKIFKKSKLHYNLLVVPPGLLGIEYTKTHIFSPDKDNSKITAIVDIVAGRGIILIQQMKEKGEFDFETEVNFVSVFRVKKGDRIAIPQGYMYTFINASGSPFVVARIYEDDGKIDYRTIWREQGMAYYVIRKNARREVVKNPRYKDVPKVRSRKAEDTVKEHRLTSSQPIYTQLVSNFERFVEILG